MKRTTGENQFRLFSIAVLALAALACVQESGSSFVRSEIAPTTAFATSEAEVPSADLEIDAINEVEALNAPQASAFSFSKSGYGD